MGDGEQESIQVSRGTSATNERRFAIPEHSNRHFAFTNNFFQQPLAIAKRHLELKAGAEAKNVPINFWGTVINQAGEPLEGVKIKASVRQWYMQSVLNPEARFVTNEVETGKDGLFQIIQQRGNVLTFETFEKEGHEVSPKVPKTYGYNISENFTPNQNAPVVFTMWKKGETQHLIKYELHSRIPYDGTPVIFDLIEGRRASATNMQGDLRISLIRNPLKLPLGGTEKFEWTGTIEALDGGVLESNDEFMYEAPASGYGPQIQIKVSTSDANWTPWKTISFYFKTRSSPYFGRCMVEFRTDSPRETTGFSLVSAVNPSGSRSLE